VSSESTEAPEAQDWSVWDAWLMEDEVKKQSVAAKAYLAPEPRFESGEEQRAIVDKQDAKMQLNLDLSVEDIDGDMEDWLERARVVGGPEWKKPTLWRVFHELSQQMEALPRQARLKGRAAGQAEQIGQAAPE